MISKKFVAVLCIAVVIGAVGGGFVGYVIASNGKTNLENRVDSLQETVSSLEGQIDELENETDRLKNELTHKKNIRTFNFYWEASIAEYFNVTRFWMNVTFERVNETHLIITVKTNDLRDNWDLDSYVGISSELTWDYLESPVLRSKTWLYECSTIPWDNFTVTTKLRGALGDYYIDDQRFIESIAMTLFPSNHKFEYNPQLGVTYIIPVRLVDLEIDNYWIHVEYAHKVSVEFCFGMELVA